MLQTLLPSKNPFSPFFSPLRIPALLSLFWVLTVFSSEAFALSREPGTIYYVTEFGSGAKSGLSWNDASPYPQAMLNNSTSGDEIWVAAGTYNIAPGEDGFRLTNGVKLYGGFAGNEGILTERDLTLTDNRSILSAGGSNKYVLANNAVTSATLVDGFTLTGGTQAGIFNYGSSPVLVNLRITGNSGIGMANVESSSPVLINCAIVRNTSFIGGILNQKSSPVFINCTIARNSSGGQGIGVYNTDNSSPKILNCIISGRSEGVKDMSSTTDIQHSLVFVENYFDSNGNLVPNNRDPLFVDPAAGDFTLQRCSPAVNVGSNSYYASGQIPDISTVTIDADGNPRFYSMGVVDMGAYEYQGDRGSAGLPGIWYVKEGGTGPGLSWECATNDLMTVLQLAVSGEQIWVAGGIYEASNGRTFAMKEGVMIYGGFAGTEASLPERDLSITANKSVLRRNSGAVIENVNTGLTKIAVLDGFTITGGGSGIINFKVSPMLVNLIITGNGGGIANAQCSPYLINCAIIGNAGTGISIGVSNSAASPVFVNCTIADNKSTGQLNVGMYNAQNSSPVIRNSIISGNQNGVYNENGSTATIEYSIVETNQPTDPSIPQLPSIDPLFVDAAGGDYRLQACSPAVNKGFNYYQIGQTPDLSAIITDLDSKPRLREHIVDMGAYEFSGASRELATDLDEASATISRDDVLTSFNSECRLMAYLLPNGAAPVAGSISAKVWVAGSQPVNFVKRHYQITPGTNTANATAKLILYFTQQEFTDFNAASSVKLPVDAADTENYKANLRIEKRPGFSIDGSGLPNSYIGTISTFTPSEANGKVEWNADAQYWEVSFNVTGFSGFFVKTIETALPLNLISFAATKEVGNNLLQWSTSSEVNTDHFEIQSSGDAKKFIKLAAVDAIGSGDHQYSYNDRRNDGGATYYRLKMSDLDGTYTFSKIVSLSGDGNFDSIYPNPAEAMITFQVNNALLNTTATLRDLTGRKLQTIVITSNRQAINIKSLSGGMYILKFADGTSERFVKK